MSDSVVLRWADSGDYPDAVRIWQRVYGSDVISDEELTPLEFHQYVIGTVGGVPAFAAIVCDYPTFFRGQVVKGAGVAAVATLPEFRGGGVGQQMMLKLNDLLFEGDWDLAMLYGFRESFYQKSGYEACGWRWRVECPVHQLPKVDGGLVVREINPKDVHLLGDCYREFAGKFNGSCDRTSEHWRRRLGKKPPLIYAVGDPIEGYLWCNPHGFWVDLEIGEIAWTSLLGYESLLGLMRTLGINKTKAIWNEPPDSGFARRFMEGNVEMSRHRPTMFQIINPGHLMALCGPVDGETLNYDRFRIASEGREIGVGPEVNISWRQLGQAIMGSPSFGEMVTWGEVTGDAGAIEYLNNFLRPMPVCCMEFF